MSFMTSPVPIASATLTSPLFLALALEAQARVCSYTPASRKGRLVDCRVDVLAGVMNIVSSRYPEDTENHSEVEITLGPLSREADSSSASVTHCFDGSALSVLEPAPEEALYGPIG